LFTRTLTILFGIALFGATLVPVMKADEWNKKTTITINEPIQMPHVVLQPGTYVFKLMNSSSDRHIVQIFNQDESHLVTTILAIPNYRLTPTGKSTFQFWETPAGQPKAMRAWFYPGDNFGQEFAYPKAAAIEIAKVANTPVLVVAAEKPEVAELTVAPMAVVDATGAESAVVKTAPALEAQALPPTADMAPSPGPAPATLPATGSYLPLIALLGFASLSIVALMSRSARIS
jgi:hypothetical protein